MVNVAVIGTGYIGLLHSEAAFKSEKLNLVAVAERNEGCRSL